jgi:oxygen-independent coproporphyrinogen III oxidase
VLRLSSLPHSGYGLYVHIPFCVRKCPYCDFYSVETLKGSVADRLATPLPRRDSFLDALERELAGLPTAFRPATIFIGGGTPTELAETDLERLLRMLHAYVDCAAVREWTCESNPGTLTAAKARLLKDAGVDRVSLGVQSFDAANLRFLGRIHGSAEAVAAYHLLRKTGFSNINLDLIHGIPGGDLDRLRADLEQIGELKPEHVSCYQLTFEEGTPLMAMKKRGQVREVPDEAAIAEDRLIRDTLREAGYMHYEISNYAQPGYACRHHHVYWQGGEYIGCGPSAHSHWQGRRYANVRLLRRYEEALLSGESPVTEEEVLTGDEKARETLVTWLRLLAGVPAVEFERVTGTALRTLAGETLDHLCAIGMLRWQADCVQLTEQGRLLSNRVFAELI